MSYFKVDSSEEFIEWKKMPGAWEKTNFQAKILPDRVFIQDMLSEPSEYWDSLTEQEFDEFFKSMK